METSAKTIVRCKVVLSDIMIHKSRNPVLLGQLKTISCTFLCFGEIKLTNFGLNFIDQCKTIPKKNARIM